MGGPKHLPLGAGSLISDTLVELELDEEGTRISLTIVDTPGFGDQIDNESRWAMRLAPRPQQLMC